MGVFPRTQKTRDSRALLSGTINLTQSQLPEGQGRGGLWSEYLEAGSLQTGPDTLGPTASPSPSHPPDDKLEQQHSLFTHYKDPCRLGPGEEKPWAIGELGLGQGLGPGLGPGAEGDGGRALPRSEPTVLGPDTVPRLGSPQAFQGDSQDLPPRPHCWGTLGCPGQQKP